MAMSRPIIVGGGHNGLVCAAYLAKAGLRPIVLEAREDVGGCAVTRELVAGVRVPVLSHTASLRADVVDDLDLARNGLTTIAPDVTTCVPTLDGRVLVLHRDVDQTARSLAQWSATDAARWPAFHQAAGALTAALSGLLSQVPPSIDTPAPGELWDLLRTGRRLRALGRHRLYDLLRWGPMPIADLASEWCETPALRAAVCARGTFGMNGGPRSAGTTTSWLLQVARDGNPAGAPAYVAGGPGALATALARAATAAGAEIRTGARVIAIEAGDEGVTGVTLQHGEQLATTLVVAGTDPRHALLTLVDPVRLPPSFRQQVMNYRAAGVLSKVNLVLSALPAMRGLDGTGVSATQALAGRVQIGSDPDYLERAFDASKYGAVSDQPWIEVTFPTVTDPSLAPGGQHVLSAYVQWTPYRLRGAEWGERRDALGDTVIRTLSDYFPDLAGLILAREVLTPLDLEQQFGLTGGHIFHGEHALDQLYAMRPVLGWAQHRTPVPGLYLCSAGTHPGGGLTGAPGAHAARVVAKDAKRH